MSNKRVKQLVYQFREGSRYGIPASVAGEELARIRETHGSVQPGTVVEESRPEAAPLHPIFEWDDYVAAEGYRKWQARSIIRSVIAVQEKGAPPTSVYVHVSQSTDDTESGYQPVSVVVQRPDLYTQAIAHLAGKMESARKALDELKSAAETAPDTDHERMARINIAVQAMQTASAAVMALH